VTVRRPLARHEVLALALLVPSLALISFSLLSVVWPDRSALPDRPDILDFLAALSVILSMPLVGAVLAIKRPDNPIGWLFLVCGAGTGASGSAAGRSPSRGGR
jgi:hypothetical protein